MATALGEGTLCVQDPPIHAPGGWALIHALECLLHERHHREILDATLNSSGQPIKSAVELWIESREVVPKGTFWTDEQRTQATQKLSIVDAPTSWNPMGSLNQQLTPAQVEEGVAAINRGRFSTK